MTTRECLCQSCRSLHPVIYEPGACEAVLQCQACGQLWYSLLYECPNFDGGNDALDEYQIPLTAADYARLRASPSACPDLYFLRGRTARVLYAGGGAEVASDFALGRCGRA